MSSQETEEGDFEVEVAPLPMRIPSIRIEDGPAAATSSGAASSLVSGTSFRLNPTIQLLNPKGTLQPLDEPRQLDRICASTSSEQLLRLMDRGQQSLVGDDVLNLLRDSFCPIQDFDYQRNKPSHEWASVDKKSLHRLLLQLCEEAEKLLRVEPMLLRFDGSPAYVMGDLHGNYKDLMTFADTFWKLGLKLCPARVVCLGDYVDRGPHSIETIAYLLALKLTAPHKIHLIRGNHELKDVNGDVGTYGATSFLAQCRKAFGVGKGDELWEAVNNCFDQMPVAAIIGGKIFCVHGGVPREAVRNPGKGILANIQSIPKGYVDTDDNEVLLDLLWADPSTKNEEDEIEHDDSYPEGFAPNPSRSGGTCVFGTYAVNAFRKEAGITHIIRAHQPPQMGISFGKNAQVITVFSSSHYCGGFNSAAVVLVADHKLNVIVTSGAVGKAHAAAAAAAAPAPAAPLNGHQKDEAEDADDGKPRKKPKPNEFKVPALPGPGKRGNRAMKPAAAAASESAEDSAEGVRRSARRKS